MANPVLIVPVQLDALVANKNLLNRDGDLRSWQFNYKALSNYTSPQPPAFGNQTGTTAPGVFLHWNLPRALRKGKQDRVSGKIVYPLVPNRWLVVRVHGKDERHCKAWVIESDCPLTDGVKEKLPGFSVEQTSLYAVDPSVIRAWKASPDKLRNTIKLDANANGPKIANIGVTFPLEKGWNERTSKTSFLTSVAPGNAAFSIYYAQNVGVFSMYDDLAGIDKDTVSYLVSGWYSDAGDDILASWQNDKTSADPYAALLQELGWIMQGSSGDKPVQSFYEGVALSINWDRNGAPPENDPLKDVRDNSKLNVSLGNTTIDSFSALIGKQLEMSGKPAQNAKLLRAFQYDLLPLLNKVHGDVILENRIRQEWFSPEQGATKWMIAGKGSKDGEAVEISPDEIAWLTQLNIGQEKFDAGVQELSNLQWQLHAAWWKLGRNPEKFPNTKITSQQLRDFINPSNKNGITTRVIQQASKLSTLKRAVPSPKWEGNKKPEDAFADGITAFAKERKLGDNKLLKATNGPRYWKAANPVLTISGLEPSAAADPDEVLKVRSSANLITGLSCADKKITGDVLSKAIPLPAGSNTLPEICLRLLSEFFLIDPSNAAALAKAAGITEAQLSGIMQKHDAQAYSGILPSNDLQPWSQPWEPIFVEWQVNYKHIPFSTGDQANWNFNGDDYSYTAQNDFSKNKGRSIGGISLLGSHPQTLFRKRLKEYLQKYKNASLDEINTWITATDGWKFIAQELTGFHELLAYRDVRLFRRPGSNEAIGDEKIPLAALTGFPTEASATNVYQPVRVRNVPYLPNGE
ncbi:MAG TPA: hypothetical protein VK826_00085, partial [Bacteroidia bacterium]|nr:hypothetical protein [Bacteroidia bacterium]